MSNCIKCKSKNVIKIVYGRPNKALMDDAEKGLVILGGCSMSDKKLFCKDCKTKF